MVLGRYEDSYIKEVFEEIQIRGLNPQVCIVVQMYNANTGVLHVMVENVITKEMFTHYIKEDVK